MKLACMAAGIALAIATIMAKPAKAEIDLYTHIDTKETVQTETNAIYKADHVWLGWNNIVEDGEKPANVFSLRLFNDCSSFYLHANEDEDLEAKLNLKTGEAIYVDVGVGDDQLFHTGVLLGRSKPFGAGVSYVRNVEGEEFRWQAWKQWKNGLFTGVRRAYDKLLTIISRPDDEGLAVRFANSTHLNEDRTSSQLVIGNSRPTYYGLNFNSDWSWLNDSSIVGNNPVCIGNNPFRYIPPPLAWLVKDYGVRLEHTMKDYRSVWEAEIASYLDDEYWVSTEMRVSEDKHSIGFKLGRASDKIKFSAGVGLEKGEASVSLTSRWRF